jgi:hypothetical protein
MHTCDAITYYGFVDHELITKTIKGFDSIIGINASNASHVWGHDMARYGKDLVPHKCPRKNSYFR